jgi:hypothetical protein
MAAGQIPLEFTTRPSLRTVCSYFGRMPLSCDNLGRLKSFLIETFLATLRACENFGRTSPRSPQVVQVKLGSMSDSRTSSPQRHALISVEWLQR